VVIYWHEERDARRIEVFQWSGSLAFIRPMGGREGLLPDEVIAGHTHNLDHTSIFFCGLWRARKWQRLVNEDEGAGQAR
jgi:hypothetical protein